MYFIFGYILSKVRNALIVHLLLLGFLLWQNQQEAPKRKSTFFLNINTLFNTNILQRTKLSEYRNLYATKQTAPPYYL